MLFLNARLPFPGERKDNNERNEPAVILNANHAIYCTALQYNKSIVTVIQ